MLIRGWHFTLAAEKPQQQSKIRMQSRWKCLEIFPFFWHFFSGPRQCQYFVSESLFCRPALCKIYPCIVPSTREWYWYLIALGCCCQKSGGFSYSLVPLLYLLLAQDAVLPRVWANNLSKQREWHGTEQNVYWRFFYMHVLSSWPIYLISVFLIYR